MSSMANASLEEMRQISARICRDYLTGKWKSITADEIVFRRISGGLSNFLYYVSLPDNNGSASPSTSSVQGRDTPKTTTKRLRKDSGQRFCEPKEVLLRVYGQTHGGNLLEMMVTESVVFALLSERNLGPKLHGIFPGGRIEQYIPARPLITKELAEFKISSKISEKMAEIHSLDIPLSKEPDWLWKSMDRWITSVLAILENVTNQHEYQDQISEIQEIDFVKEVDWLKGIITNGEFPVVFCHNDLQEGNILLKEEMANSSMGSINSLNNAFEDSALGVGGECSSSNSSLADERLSPTPNNNGSRKRYHSSDDTENETRDSVLSNITEDCSDSPDLIIIDYEYCAYNYRGFDLANHFIEWTFDYTNVAHPFYYHYLLQYPSRDQRKEFISSYLRKLNELDEYGELSYTPSGDEIKSVEEEVKVFTLVSHLFWSLWAIVNVYQNIEFGYWDYAISRLQEYKTHKAAYLKESKE